MEKIDLFLMFLILVTYLYVFKSFIKYSLFPEHIHSQVFWLRLFTSLFYRGSCHGEQH